MDSTNEGPKGQAVHSWQIVRHILNNSDLTLEQTHILMYLADHANREKGWKCWTGVELIAARCKVSDSTVSRTTRLLAERGYLRKERTKTTPSRNEYFLNLEAIFSMKSTVLSQGQIYSCQPDGSSPVSQPDLDLALRGSNRLSSSGYDYQATTEQARVSLRLSDASCDAVYVKKRPLADSQVQGIFEAIDPYLIQTLTKIEAITMGKDAPTYSDQLRGHIKWRAEDLDWQAICFTVAKGWIEGVGKEYAVRCPSALTFTVADNPHLYDGVVYDSKELDRLIRSYNAKMSA